MNLSDTQTDVFAFVGAASRLAKNAQADAILLLIEEELDWNILKKKSSSNPGTLLIATPNAEVAESAREAGLTTCFLEVPATSVHDQLTQAVLANVADEALQPGSTVVAVYSGFDTENVDSISVVRLTERLGRLTARDLKKLKTKVPLDTLRLVVDLAVQIGRDGREGKPIGTMFVVGDHRKVLEESRPASFDFVRGYTRKERNISDFRVREGVKEMAQMDGMFVIASDGTVEASCRLVDTSPVELTMTTGLGSRHFAGAAISKTTSAIAVVVSQSNGTVRIFQNGEVVLRIEPLERAMKWKDFDSDTSSDAT